MRNRNKLVEEFAEIEHNQWVIWSKEIAKTENISKERLERWKKLWIPYKDLPEKVKEQDRIYARYVAEKVRTERAKCEKEIEKEWEKTKVGDTITYKILKRFKDAVLNLIGKEMSEDGDKVL